MGKKVEMIGRTFGRNFEQELEAAKKYEPKLYAAATKIFGKSYEYTREYKKFCEEQKRSGQLKIEGV